MSEDHTYQGHHRVWHVLEPSRYGGTHSGRGKLAEPRVPPLWFDRRCFETEEDLVAELAELGMDRVPAVRRVPVDGSGDPDRRLLIQDFVEGHTLAEEAAPGTAVPEHHLSQIMERFRQLASVRPKQVRTHRRCAPEERAEDWDTPAFLRTLLAFTRSRVHARWSREHPELFAALRIPAGALAPGSRLDREAGRLTPRPFCLLHGDLHRTNLIVDAADGRLWTIDWELAMLGDPLYDLATHLHLTGYPPRQEREVVARWCETVPKVLIDADAGIERDLPRYRAYKCAQSLLTDVVRHAHRVRAASPGERTAQLRATGETVSALLRRAAGVLGIGTVLSARDVSAAYAAHAVSAAPAPPSAAAGPADGAATRRDVPAAASPRARSGSG